MVPELFVVAPLAQFGFGVRGHERVVVRGIEQHALRRTALARPYSLEKSPGYIFHGLDVQPVPLLPVALRAQLLDVHWPDLLDGRAAVPLLQSPFAPGID